jgi:hypothetical protein
VACEPELRFLAAKSAHRVAGVLYLDSESGDQRVFRVNDDVPRFSLKFKADRKLHPRSPALVKGSIEL